METFFPLLAFWAGNSPVTGEFHAQRTVTRGFDVFFDMRLNKRLSKQSWGWWFETPLHSLWRHFNGPWTRAQLLFRTVYHLTCNCFVLHTTCCNHAKPFIFLTEHITLVGPFINSSVWVWKNMAISLFHAKLCFIPLVIGDNGVEFFFIWFHHSFLGPLLPTWFNFNPSMDK